MKILKPPYPVWPGFHAVDPGVAYYACAWFMHGHLSQVWMGVSGEDKREFCHLVIEMPQVYRHGQARLKDVTELAFAAGAIAAQYENVVRYLPAEWKGQVPKGLHQQRIVGVLSPDERKILDGIKKKDLHHIVDAVGLGLFHLGRLGR